MWEAKAMKGMEMTEKEIINKLSVLEMENAFEEVFSRKCTHADLEGLRKIIIENPNICLLKINKPLFSEHSTETFYRCTSKNPNDSEFIIRLREQILKI